MKTIQIALAAPFLTSPALARDYFTSAFDFSRSFLFKWSVNWNFVGESIFNSSEFKYGLLICHVSDILTSCYSLFIIAIADKLEMGPGISPCSFCLG